MSLSLQEDSLSYILNLAAGILAFGGSALMSWFCLRISGKWSVSMKLLLAIALSDLFGAISNLLSAFDKQSTDALCYIEAILRESSFILTVLWTSCIAILCYKIAHPNRFFNQNYFFKGAVLTGVIICLGLLTAPLMTPQLAYQKSDIFCWISYSDKVTTSNGQLLILMIYEGIPVILGFIITLIGYIKVIKTIRGLQLPNMILQEMNVPVFSLLWYPFVLCITFVPSLIDNIRAIYISERIPAIEAIHLLLTHSLGLTNAVVYGCQRNLYRSRPKEDTMELLKHTNEVEIENSLEGSEVSTSVRKGFLQAIHNA